MSANARRYDAIVVGARCAGATTAMLLARKGYDVLLVDRARFPSDTVSTHLIHPPGVDVLRRWGLLDPVAATGCPPISSYTFDFGPVVLTGTARSAEGTAVAYCPRRTVLDALLVEAAAQAGAEMREGFSVGELLFDGDTVIGVRGRAGGGPTTTEHARVVIGADGVRSRVAEAARAQRYRDVPVRASGYYAYWSGFRADGAAWAVRPRQGFAIAPTNDDLTLVLAGWPQRDLPQVKRDLQGHYLQAITQLYGGRLAGAHQETRVVGEGVPSRFRRPYGPGWALVGDAGYTKDPITALGITDAFHDAELCADALDATFRGARPFGPAMADYQQRRDARVLPSYQFTTQLANLEEPPPPELLERVGTIASSQPAMDEFASVWAGALSPADFFDPGHIGALLGTPAQISG